MNSQSGKSGAAWILQQNHGVILPRALQTHFRQIIQKQTDHHATELTASQIWQYFCDQYAVNQKRIVLEAYQIQKKNQVYLDITIDQQKFKLNGAGNGLLSATTHALTPQFNQKISVLEYIEHSLGKTSHSRSISYVLCSNGQTQHWGVAIDNDTAHGSIQAILNAYSQF